MTEVLNFFLNIICGVIASLIAIYIIFWILKPKIIISPFIVKIKNDNSYDYVFKFINKTKYPVNDIKVEMWEKTESKATSNSRGLNESHRKVKVSTAEWQTIPKKCSNKEIERTHFAPHAVKVRILDENIENILNPENNQSLEVKVSVKHGLSNISKTFSMQFNDLSCLKEGRFVFGNSLATEII